ncbi:MAG: VOC family protein [Gemmatimonadetes bacterium]|nr:VOC family protein [Gemmatimonadota bacterium]
MPNPVSWFEIYVQDMARAKTFYGKVLGAEFTLLRADGLEMWAFPADYNTYGISGTLVKMDGVPSGGNSTLIYFACEDCAVQAARVEPAGGKIFRPKFSVGEFGWVALAVDPDGNMFGLHSMA